MDSPDIIDLHSHISTAKGYRFRSDREQEKAEEAFNRNIDLRTEEEMAADFREAGVKAILDFGFTCTIEDIEEIREYNTYASRLVEEYPDVFIGFWVDMNVDLGRAAVEEVERCFDDLGTAVGIQVNGIGVQRPPSDEAYDPLYELCVEYNAPALILIGYTARGAGLPGGGGNRLEYGDPRYMDRVAAAHPELPIIASRPAWPWQSPAIASVLHKENIVGYELHGWRPKYIPDELVYECSRRLQDEVMFGGDYPIFDYDELRADWEGLDLDERTLERIYSGNAERVLSDLDITV